MKTLTLVEASQYKTGCEYLVQTVNNNFYICVYEGVYGPFQVIYSDQEFRQEDIACVYELPRGEA